jgi:hypothetical protein
MGGLRWLVALQDHGLNGILADDMVCVLVCSRPLLWMRCLPGWSWRLETRRRRCRPLPRLPPRPPPPLQGLGKTVQVIALLCYLVEVRGQAGPYMVVAPASVMANWAEELRRSGALLLGGGRGGCSSCPLRLLNGSASQRSAWRVTACVQRAPCGPAPPPPRPHRLHRWAPHLVVVEYRGSGQAREAIWGTKVGRRRQPKRAAPPHQSHLRPCALLTSTCMQAASGPQDQTAPLPLPRSHHCLPRALACRCLAACRSTCC